MMLIIKIKLVWLDCDNIKNIYKICVISVVEWVYEICIKKLDMVF